MCLRQFKKIIKLINNWNELWKIAEQQKIQWPFSEECDWEKIEFKYLSVDGSERKRIVFVYENKFAFLDLDLWKVERIDNFPKHDQIFGKD